MSAYTEKEKEILLIVSAKMHGLNGLLKRLAAELDTFPRSGELWNWIQAPGRRTDFMQWAARVDILEDRSLVWDLLRDWQTVREYQVKEVAGTRESADMDEYVSAISDIKAAYKRYTADVGEDAADDYEYSLTCVSNAYMQACTEGLWPTS